MNSLFVIQLAILESMPELPGSVYNGTLYAACMNLINLGTFCSITDALTELGAVNDLGQRLSRGPNYDKVVARLKELGGHTNVSA